MTGRLCAGIFLFLFQPESCTIKACKRYDHEGEEKRMLQVYLNLLDTAGRQRKIRTIICSVQGQDVQSCISDPAQQTRRRRRSTRQCYCIIDNLEKIKKINCHETWSYIVTIVKSRAFNIYQRKGKRSEREVKEQDYRNYPCEQQESPEDAYLLMLTLDVNTKTLLPVSDLPCILSLIQ